MSTESIASPSPAARVESCRACGAPLAEDQRYCLQCGERSTPMSSVLLGGPAAAVQPQPLAGAASGAAADAPSGTPSNAVTVIAGVGVLLLAMGVGVLIGRSTASRSSSAPAEVITVASTPSSAGSASAATAPPFTSDWPSGTNGYTVQLQALAQSSTAVSAVEAAETAAGAKGLTGVGALKSEEFSSLKAGNYVIYTGVYHSKAAAEKALQSAKKSFPAATVITVSNGSGSSSKAAGSSGSSSSPGVGASETHPAPPTVLNTLKKKSGRSYEQESRNLPDVVSTG